MPPMSSVTNRSGDSTKRFFGDIANRGPVPLLRNVVGTVRFDLAGGGHTEHWFVTLNKGEVAVSHRNGRADAVVRVDRALFDELAAGIQRTPRLRICAAPWTSKATFLWRCSSCGCSQVRLDPGVPAALRGSRRDEQ